MSLRLVLADDAALIRQALAELLQRAGVEVVAQAGNAPSLVRAVENGCGSFEVSRLRCEDEAVAVSGVVDAFVLAAQVECPVGVEVAVMPRSG